MAEIKVEKKKPMWPWIIGGLALLMIVAVFLFSDNDGNRNQESAYSDNQSEYRDTRGVTGQSNESDQSSRSRTIEDEGIDGRDERVAVGDRTSNERDTAVVAPDNTTRNIMQANNGNNAVDQYVRFVKSDLDKKDLNSQKINQAFTHLSEATSAKAEEVGYNSRNIQEARTMINQMSSASSDQATADQIRRSAQIISRELEAIQLSRFPELDDEVANVKKASESIDPNEIALNQEDEIMEFFDESAELLDKMK